MSANFLLNSTFSFPADYYREAADLLCSFPLAYSTFESILNHWGFFAYIPRHIMLLILYGWQWSGGLRTEVLLNSHFCPHILQPGTRVDARILTAPASGWATLGVCSHFKRHLQLILLVQCKLHLLCKCYWAGNCSCPAWLVSWVRSQLPTAQCSSGWVLGLALSSCTDTLFSVTDSKPTEDILPCSLITTDRSPVGTSWPLNNILLLQNDWTSKARGLATDEL